MFTGIIRKISKVEKITEKAGSLFVKINRPDKWKVGIGDSISINGVCSTVKNINSKTFEVEYMPETIKKTTVGNFQKGTIVNLEKSLRLNDLVDGHLVQGHVDTRGKIIDIAKDKAAKIMKIKIPAKFMFQLADKGSIAIDGISLTVVKTGRNWFSVSLVDYTLKNTNLGEMAKGTEVNIETDVLAKYLDKLLNQRYAKKTRK